MSLAVIATVAPISVVPVVATTVRAAVTVSVVPAVIAVGARARTGMGMAPGAASGEDPEDAALGAATEPLGVLLLVLSDGGGAAHLVDAGAAGGLVAREGAAQLDEPAMDGRGLAGIAAVGSLRGLCAKRGCVSNRAGSGRMDGAG